MARHRRRHRHRTVEHDGARDRRERPPAPRVHRGGPRSGTPSTSTRSWTGRSSEVSRDRRAGRRDPRGRPRLREGRPATICWTLGITEHHNAVDNVLSLINLALLTGHVGTYGSGVNPLRGQNNVQGGGDMGAIPNKLAGFQDIEKDAAARAKFEAAWGTPIIPKYGWHLTNMFQAMERGELTAVYCIGENPASSEADKEHAVQLLQGLDTLIVQDIFMTKTAGARRRRVPRVQQRVRVRRHGDELRAQGAAGAGGPRAAGRGQGRHLDHQPAREPHGRPAGAMSHRGGVGRAAHPQPDARRHELGAPRRARRHPVALPRRGASRHAVPARPPVGVRRPRGAGREGAVLDRDRRPAGRRAHRRVPAAPHDRSPARLLQHRGADGRVHVTAARGRRSTSRPRTPSGSASPRRSASSSRAAGGRSRCRSTSTRRSAPGSSS